MAQLANGHAVTPVIQKRQLTWFDSTSIIVGTIIGAGIYQSASGVASSVETPWALFALWLFGGCFSLCGAMCYAELASALPRSGGDLVYLNRAYGNWAGFLFGWLQMVVIRPGDIAIIAFAFATYFQTLLHHNNANPNGWTSGIAASAIVVLTLINILGVRQGKWIQNLLTSLKVLGLLGIVIVAFMAPASAPVIESANVVPESIPISVALIFVLFTFGGWNEMAYIAAEVKHPEKNLFRSLISGTVIVTFLYLMINGAFLHVLGLQGMSQSSAIATDTVKVIFPNIGSSLVSMLICISTLGTVNGMILTGSRINFALGTEHPTFRLLGRWEGRTGTPVNALLVQGLITVTLILLLGSFTSAILYTSAAVYTFYLATGIAVVVLRKNAPDLVRPYRVTGYPIPLVFFAGICLFLIYSAIRYRPIMAAAVCVLALVGSIIYMVEKRVRIARSINHIE